MENNTLELLYKIYDELFKDLRECINRNVCSKYLLNELELLDNIVKTIDFYNANIE